jgi:uncharacterized Zn finger protein (UPF0148 family)
VAILDGWHLCPRCGGPLWHEQGRVECGACAFVFYANPKPTACALVIDDDGRILVVRRAADVEKGKIASENVPLALRAWREQHA